MCRIPLAILYPAMGDNLIGPCKVHILLGQSGGSRTHWNLYPKQGAYLRQSLWWGNNNNVQDGFPITRFSSLPTRARESSPSSSYYNVILYDICYVISVASGDLWYPKISWSGLEDSNLWPPVPKTGAIPGLAKPRKLLDCKGTSHQYDMQAFAHNILEPEVPQMVLVPPSGIEPLSTLAAGLQPAVPASEQNGRDSWQEVDKMFFLQMKCNPIKAFSMVGQAWSWTSDPYLVSG